MLEIEENLPPGTLPIEPPSNQYGTQPKTIPKLSAENYPVFEERSPKSQSLNNASHRTSSVTDMQVLKTPFSNIFKSDKATWNAITLFKKHIVKFAETSKPCANCKWHYAGSCYASKRRRHLQAGEYGSQFFLALRDLDISRLRGLGSCRMYKNYWNQTQEYCGGTCNVFFATGHSDGTQLITFFCSMQESISLTNSFWIVSILVKIPIQVPKNQTQETNNHPNWFQNRSMFEGSISFTLQI